MFNNVSPKAIALGGITFAALGVIGIGVETTKGILFEIQNARAATTAALASMETSKAEMEKARAERVAADASRLDAENKLLAAIESRHGAEGAAFSMAQGQRDAAQTTGLALVKATEIDRHVDNALYDSFAGPIFAEPSKTINALNRQIVRLKREAETGIDMKSRRFLSETDKADRLAQARILEEEVITEGDTTAKNMGDMLNVMMKGVSGMMGGIGGPQPTGGSRVMSGIGGPQPTGDSGVTVGNRPLYPTGSNIYVPQRIAQEN